MLKREQQREQARQAALKALRSAGRALTVAEWAQRSGFPVNALTRMVPGLRDRGCIHVSETRTTRQNRQRPRVLVCDKTAQFSDMPAWLMPRPVQVTQGQHGNV